MKILTLILSMFLFSSFAVAGGTGFVTPTEMTITFTSLRLVKSDNSNITLLEGEFPHTFKKTDTDFSAVSLSKITAPAGRFIGASFCYNTNRTVKLNGDKYYGENIGGYTSGTTTLYSVGTDAIAPGSIQTTSTGSPTTLSGYVVGNGTNNCSTSYFNLPVCVSTDSTKCSSGDQIVNPNTSVPNLNILLDMYNSVGVDAVSNTLDNHIPVYPYPTIGTPGAAVHYTIKSGSALGNISLLFSSDKKLLYAAAYSTGTVTGMCGGNGFVNVTAAPTGAFMNNYGPTAVQSYDATGGAGGNGLVQFAAGNAGTSNNSVSSGIIQITQPLQAQGTSTIATSCVADSAATPPYLGFTYTSGSGGGGGSANYTISKIVDPSGIFSNKTGCTGICGTY